MKIFIIPIVLAFSSVYSLDSLRRANAGQCSTPIPPVVQPVVVQTQNDDSPSTVHPGMRNRHVASSSTVPQNHPLQSNSQNDAREPNHAQQPSVSGRLYPQLDELLAHDRQFQIIAPAVVREVSRIKDAPDQVVPEVVTREDDLDATNEAKAYMYTVWTRVTPMVRYPIELGVSGLRALYAVNKKVAIASCIGVTGTVGFVIWAEYRCFSMYNRAFCNPFSTPTVTDRFMRFVGL